MLQDWFIFSPNDDATMDDGEVLCWDEEADCLVDLLAVPVKPVPVKLSCAPKRLNEILETEPLPTKESIGPTCQLRSYLAAIPDELILMIFNDLDFVSCFRLSLVSKRLWRIGWPYLQHAATAYMGPWAGARIICLGDPCDPGNWPAGFLTAEEEDVVNRGLDEAELDPDPDEGFLQYPGKLLNMARRRFRVIHGGEVNPFQMLRRPVPGQVERSIDSKHWEDRRTAYDEAKHLPRLERSQVLSFAHEYEMPNYYPQTESWILRNLTTAEFVQGDKLFTAFPRSRPRRGPYLGHPGFSEAVLCRISWSRVKCAGLNPGVWAGHRFEICTEKVHTLKSDCSWKDVTSEIVDELSGALSGSSHLPSGHSPLTTL